MSTDRRTAMTDCPHDQGQHYLGDCGDMLDYIAIPATTCNAVGQTVLDTLTDMIGVARVQYPGVPGPCVVSMR